MKEDKELNKSEQRHINRKLITAQKHQEKRASTSEIDEIQEETPTKKGLSFCSGLFSKNKKKTEEENKIEDTKIENEELSINNENQEKEIDNKSKKVEQLVIHDDETGVDIHLNDLHEDKENDSLKKDSSNAKSDYMFDEVSGEDIGVKTPSKGKTTKKKHTKTDRPIGKKSTRVLAVIVSVLVILCFLGGFGAILFARKLCDNKPELNVSDLIAPDSSTIYDNQNNKIMQIGMYLRENIEYNEMPNCLIDAFLATEDSRFFEHFGVDIPRFTKSLISYVTTGSEYAQGGSTITMQLIKNTYYTKDAGDDSTIASREGMAGIKRKMQEIVLSLQLELFKGVSKKDIIKMYINKVNYGDNIRGVEKAAEYYFGKSAKELTLSESAFLAGIVNSPASYNPYGNIYKKTSIYYDENTDYVKNGTQRRNEVLNLMEQHGYITAEECKLAKSIKLEDLLVGPADDFGNTNEKYQWYIDAVIDEVEEVTGESPYNVGMNIYTNMNPYMQEYLYDIQNEAEYTEIVFPNELCQSAVVLLDNQTGAVEALGGGRGESDSARKFNRATSAYLNPGSSFKPVVDYSLAIEKLGWATSHTLTDQPYYLYNGNVLISNFDHTYYGDMMMTEALGRSQNTPAVQTLVAVVEEIGEEAVVDYLNSIGFNFEYEDFDLQFAIGGNRCLVTPEQLAGAHAIFMNKGMYVKPHTINHIEYVDGREDYVADTVGTSVLSPETAWMTAYLEKYNMDGYYSSLMWYCKRDYPLYGKTGTTDWGNAGVSYGIPVGATKDSWLVMQTNRYTISCWTGYDELAEGAYFSSREYNENTKSKIVSAVLDQLEEHASYEKYDPYQEMEKPSGIVEITHVRGSYPYAESGGSLVTGYTSKAALEKQPLASYSEAIEYSSKFKKYVDAGVSNLNGYYDGNTVTVSFTVGSGEGGLISGDSVDLSTTNAYGETTHAAGRIWFPHWVTIYTGVANPPYTYRVTVDGAVTAEGTTDALEFSAPAPGTRCEACVWPADGGEVCKTFTVATE